MPSEELAYKRNLNETIARLEALWTGRMPHGICATMHGWPNPYLEEWRQKWHPPAQGTERDLPSKEEIFEHWDALLRGRSEVEDDSLPVAYACLDWGESGFAGFLGAKVHFYSRGENGGTYSYAEPLLADWSQLEELRLEEQNRLYAAFLETLRYVVTRAEGLFGVNAFLRIDALTLAMELRGATRALLDLYEFPKQLERLLRFGVELNAQILEQEYAIIPPFRGGRFTWIGGWVPHISPVPLSVDPYVYCASWVYRDFGEAYQLALLERFGSGFFHLHGYRLDLLAAIKELPGVLFVQGVESGGGLGEAAFAHLEAIKQVAGTLPLLISCTYQELLAGLKEHSLPGGVMYDVSGVPTVYEANKAMELVRSYEAQASERPPEPEQAARVMR